MNGMEVFDVTRLGATVRGLSEWKRMAFIAYCCERMLPNYRSFRLETFFGDLNVLRFALDAVWDWIESGKNPESKAGLISACEKEAPDTAEFKSPYTSAALDAATAIALTIQALGRATEDRAIEIASLARDTVDIYVQETLDLDPNDPHFEEKIVSSTLMQAELRLQRESLGVLEDLPEDRFMLGSELRLRWSRLDGGSLPSAQ